MKNSQQRWPENLSKFLSTNCHLTEFMLCVRSLRPPRFVSALLGNRGLEWWRHHLTRDWGWEAHLRCQTVTRVIISQHIMPTKGTERVKLQTFLSFPWVSWGRGISAHWGGENGEGDVHTLHTTKRKELSKKEVGLTKSWVSRISGTLRWCGGAQTS